ncbi:hypothetical protein K504DRAFT_207604 [Pleomassaria siparia CBS 279.74]|uniref:Uncharacterized protein n=1 Tax=Pleomassaria siparia CBS 279.74 TaxID=1314801 RepID=A0A6G1KIF2_9PLEO|nr:hypothetical protein K504DRAFT_207604 [Pleomassaria siparia CBS 279.74]
MSNYFDNVLIGGSAALHAQPPTPVSQPGESKKQSSPSSKRVCRCPATPVTPVRSLCEGEIGSEGETGSEDESEDEERGQSVAIMTTTHTPNAHPRLHLPRDANIILLPSPSSTSIRRLNGKEIRRRKPVSDPFFRTTAEPVDGKTPGAVEKFEKGLMRNDVCGKYCSLCHPPGVGQCETSDGEDDNDGDDDDDNDDNDGPMDWEYEMRS